MGQIVPTVTEKTASEFHKKLEMLTEFADRVHLDFSDGDFSPVKMMDLKEASWPEGLTVDLHLMFERPRLQLDAILDLKPDTVVLHVESENFQLLLEPLRKAGIKIGLAILPDTDIKKHTFYLSTVDQILVFGGRLGYQGGLIKLDRADIIDELKKINSKAEIAWDGGINTRNIRKLKAKGVTVFNVGGGISHAKHPEEAYKTLKDLINE